MTLLERLVEDLDRRRRFSKDSAVEDLDKKRSLVRVVRRGSELRGRFGHRTPPQGEGEG